MDQDTVNTEIDYDDTNDRRVPLVNAHGQEGQGIGVFSLAIAIALASHWTPVREARETFIRSVKTSISEKFSVAAQQQSPEHNCMMVALSHSPPVGCSFEKK